MTSHEGRKISTGQNPSGVFFLPCPPGLRPSSPLPFARTVDHTTATLPYQNKDRPTYDTSSRFPPIFSPTLSVQEDVALRADKHRRTSRSVASNPPKKPGYKIQRSHTLSSPRAAWLPTFCLPPHLHRRSN